MDLFANLPRKTSFLIAGLAIITGFFLWLAITTNPEKSTPKATAVLPTPTPVAQTTMSLDLLPTTTSSRLRIVSVGINTRNNKVTAVQLELNFDPKLLTSFTATPGSFFNNPNVLFKDIDLVAGHISYAIVMPPSQKGVSGIGEVARLSFIPNSATTSAMTSITTTQKTLITADGVLDSVLTNYPSVDIQLASTVPTITTTPISLTTTPTPPRAATSPSLSPSVAQ